MGEDEGEGRLFRDRLTELCALISIFSIGRRRSSKCLQRCSMGNVARPASPETRRLPPMPASAGHPCKVAACFGAMQHGAEGWIREKAGQVV